MILKFIILTTILIVIYKLVEFYNDNQKFKIKINKIECEKSELLNKNKELKKSLNELSSEHNLLIDGYKKKDGIFEILKSQNKETFSQISSLYSDFLLIQYEISINYLESKKHPAKIEAKRIKELKSESKIHVEQFRQMLYKYEYLLGIFPELSDYVDDLETLKQLEQIDDLKNLEDDFDRTQFYLSKEEFRNLSMDERNQLALDRYITGQKTKWQIGRDYELYCGIEYEQNGWDVEYIGMEQKLHDMGRDLIAKSANTHLIIQCKYWSKEKKIHEKHITQLFGTTIEYKLNVEPSLSVTPVFITNISLSDKAKSFADTLGVIVRENHDFREFPRIKCNISKEINGQFSKIYHLPFDQQYDRTKINQTEEFYAFSVKEAVEKGFRRAYRYFGN